MLKMVGIYKTSNEKFKATLSSKCYDRPKNWGMLNFLNIYVAC
jgi:hypothetical protein